MRYLQRRDWQERYDARYTDHGFDTEEKYKLGDVTFYAIPCYYCGDPSESIDHAYPLIALAVLVAAGGSVNKKRLIRVPACTECNSILGDRVFRDMRARKRWLAMRLTMRYKKILKMPLWSDRELGELGYNLRMFVLAGCEARKVIERRIEWMNK